MGNGKFKKQQIKATILLEALLALGIFSIIASLLLHQISYSRRETLAILQKEEVLRVAQMALQTGQDQLQLNGIQVQVQRNKDQIRVFYQGEELIHVEKR
nr:competence type IV pilus minor pilin ComGE [Streptococcus sp. oral taxon 056]